MPVLCQSVGQDWDEEAGKVGHLTGESKSLAQCGPKRGGRREPSAHEHQREAICQEHTPHWSGLKPQIDEAYISLHVLEGPERPPKGTGELWQRRV